MHTPPLSLSTRMALTTPRSSRRPWNNMSSLLSSILMCVRVPKRFPPPLTSPERVPSSMRRLERPAIPRTRPGHPLDLQPALPRTRPGHPLDLARACRPSNARLALPDPCRCRTISGSRAVPCQGGPLVSGTHRGRRAWRTLICSNQPARRPATSTCPRRSLLSRGWTRVHCHRQHQHWSASGCPCPRRAHVSTWIRLSLQPCHLSTCTHFLPPSPASPRQWIPVCLC